MGRWPYWWAWELDCSDHVVARLVDRAFTETDLREMLEGAQRIRRLPELRRFAVETTWARRAWRVIVEPEFSEQRIRVVTAFEVG